MQFPIRRRIRTIVKKRQPVNRLDRVRALAQTLRQHLLPCPFALEHLHEASRFAQARFRIDRGRDAAGVRRVLRGQFRARPERRMKKA